MLTRCRVLAESSKYLMHYANAQVPHGVAIFHMVWPSSHNVVNQSGPIMPKPRNSAILRNHTMWNLPHHAGDATL